MDASRIIVSGGDALATTIAEELKSAGVRVVKLDDTEVADTETDLAEAGIADAVAVVCGGEPSRPTAVALTRSCGLRQ